MRRRADEQALLGERPQADGADGDQRHYRSPPGQRGAFGLQPGVAMEAAPPGREASSGSGAEPAFSSTVSGQDDDGDHRGGHDGAAGGEQGRDQRQGQRLLVGRLASTRSQRTAEPALSSKPSNRSTTARPRRTGSGNTSEVNASTAMPPARSAREVRIHARKVRSLARVNRGSGSVSPGSGFSAMRLLRGSSPNFGVPFSHEIPFLGLLSSRCLTAQT